MNLESNWWQQARTWLKGGKIGVDGICAPQSMPPPPYMVNLGCGARFHAHWINLDVAPQAPEVRQHDLREPLPFPDGICVAVYCSHVLEHFPKAKAPGFLRECHRVLRPGGVLRVVVPDLETITRLYLENLAAALAGDADAEQRHEWMTLELLDQMVREESGGEMLKYWRRNPMPAETFVLERVGQEARQAVDLLRQQTDAPPPTGPHSPHTVTVNPFRDSGEVHKWMYDRLSLGRLLGECEFTEVKVCRADESRIPGFNDYHLDIDDQGSVRKPDSLFMEGVKQSNRI